MCDILQVLPSFKSTDFNHILPSIEKVAITTSDLICLTPREIAKRATVPPVEVAKLTEAVVKALQSENPRSSRKFDFSSEVNSISTLDDGIDRALGGGIPPGYVTEITGESGVGKTQFLLSLLLSVQLGAPRGMVRSALYISTEAALPTFRLKQLLQEHPVLSNLPESEKPSLDRVLSIQTPDLESQDHILRFQVPVAIRRQNVGLLVIDSIAANFRAEFERPDRDANTAPKARSLSQGGLSATERKKGQSMADRRPQLVQLGALLRNLAQKENIAIVVSNQIADRFAPNVNYSASCPPPSTSNGITPDPLTLDHQQRWFSGWGDLPEQIPGHRNLKTPSLGLVWSNQIAARIALIKDDQQAEGSTKQRRWMRLVFAPWAGATDGAGIEYDISEEGIKAIETVKDSSTNAS